MLSIFYQFIIYYYRQWLFILVSCHDQEQDEKDFFEEDYNFIYVLHPEPVQSFSWRKTSKHMPLYVTK